MVKMSFASANISSAVLRTSKSATRTSPSWIRRTSTTPISTLSSPSASTSTWPTTTTATFGRLAVRNLSCSAVKSNAQAPAHSTPQDEGEKKIYNLLKDSFSPKELKVQDVSGGCGSFYAITLSSKSFAGVPTVKAHRMVNETLKEIIPGIHGLQLKTIAEE